VVKEPMNLQEKKEKRELTLPDGKVLKLKYKHTPTESKAFQTGDYITL